MRPLFRIASIAVVVPIALAFAVAAQPRMSVSPRVDLQPSVVRFGDHATIAVSGIDVRFLEVRFDGATYADGEPLRWHSLRFVDGAWRGTLPAPAWRGVYPVELRTGAGASLIKPAGVFLRVFARGTVHGRPSPTRSWLATPRRDRPALMCQPRLADQARAVHRSRRSIQ
jgi:hypothetical protein